MKIGLYLWGILSVLLAISTAPSYAKPSWKFPKFETITGGIVRYPNSLQAGENTNGYGEGFIKISLPVWTVNKTKLSVFFRNFYNRDTKQYDWNNRSKYAAGLNIEHKFSKKLSANISVAYEWDYRLGSGALKTGVRANANYFYYDSHWRNKSSDHTGKWFLQNSWFKTWGSLTFPESLERGNSNISFITGGEVAWAFVRNNKKLQYVPFAEFTIAIDSYGLKANNKIIPAAGFKLRKSIKGGEMTIGFKVLVDHRWSKSTTKAGIGVFAGWYKGF